jgi:predicted O-methyltransferase YrrM
MRHCRPKRIVEIGSGYSSCVMLDTNKEFFQESIQLTFIEPYPDVLRGLLNPEDATRCTIIPQKVQDVPLEVFEQLEPGDMLFIDSSHVSKAGSDVHYELFQILPRLKRGVFIHVHDIFDGFEYPEEWLREGRAWNEAYLLRAFLQFNSAFRIVLFNTLMERLKREWFAAHIPDCLKNTGGSIWLEKVA